MVGDGQVQSNINQTDNKDLRTPDGKNNSVPSTGLRSHEAEKKSNGQPSAPQANQANVNPEATLQKNKNLDESQKQKQTQPTDTSDQNKEVVKKEGEGGNNPQGASQTKTEFFATDQTEEPNASTKNISLAKTSDDNSPKTSNIKGLKIGMKVSWITVAAGIAAAAVTLVLMLASPIAIPLYAVLIPAGIALALSIPAIITTVLHKKAKNQEQSSSAQDKSNNQNNDNIIHTNSNNDEDVVWNSIKENNKKEENKPLFDDSEDENNANNDVHTNDFEEWGEM